MLLLCCPLQTRLVNYCSTWVWGLNWSDWWWPAPWRRSCESCWVRAALLISSSEGGVPVTPLTEMMSYYYDAFWSVLKSWWSSWASVGVLLCPHAPCAGGHGPKTASNIRLTHFQTLSLFFVNLMFLLYVTGEFGSAPSGLVALLRRKLQRLVRERALVQAFSKVLLILLGTHGPTTAVLLRLCLNSAAELFCRWGESDVGSKTHPRPAPARADWGNRAG